MTIHQFKRLTDKITKALTKGVEKAIQEHLQRGNPVYVMKDEKIVTLKPKKHRV